MGERVRRMTAREVEGLLRADGFVLVSQRGSHRKWRHDGKRLQVVVPDHGGRPHPIGTLLAIVKGAELPEQQYRG